MRGAAIVAMSLTVATAAHGAVRPLRWEAATESRGTRQRLPIPAADQAAHAIGVGLRDWRCTLRRTLMPDGDGGAIDAVALRCATTGGASVVASAACEITDDDAFDSASLSLIDASGATTTIVVICRNDGPSK